GPNAVLLGLLLLGILGVINLLASVRLGPLGFFSRPWDWTAAQIYSPKPATRNFVKSLDKPVKLYYLNVSAAPGYRETDALLQSFRSINDKVTYVSLSRDLDKKELEALQQKDKIRNEELGGVLVVYGVEPAVQHEYIPRRDLVTEETVVRRFPDGSYRRVDPNTGQEVPEKYLFKGEASLLKTLEFLKEGKKLPVVYFTQRN